MQPVSALHSAQCSLQVCCILPIPPLDCTEHSISTGQNTHESRQLRADAVPFWHLCFWATVLGLFYWVAARLIVLPRTLFPVLTGSCMARSLPTPMLTSTSTSTLQTCFFRLFCPPCLALHQPALPQSTRSSDEGLGPAHVDPCSPEASDGLECGGVLVSLLSAPILAHARLSALSVPFSSRQSSTSRALVLHTPLSWTCSYLVPECSTVHYRSLLYLDLVTLSPGSRSLSTLGYDAEL